MELMRGISSGQFRPGEKLNEVDIAARLSVSRNTLREAFATLTAGGLLTRIPNRGVFITEPTLEQLQELYTTRQILEPGALRWGARRGLDRLDGIVAAAEKIRDSASSEAHVDMQLISDANQEFHRTIVASACSSHLDATMGRVLAQMRVAFLHAIELEPAFHTQFIADNRAVADLISAGDFSKAADTLAQTLDRTREDLKKYF